MAELDMPAHLEYRLLVPVHFRLRIQERFGHLQHRLDGRDGDRDTGQGGESGGHIGELTTMALVPQVCDAVDLPVIAAGGIADGRGMAAALALGAEAVQIGTRFLSAKECNIHENYKKKVLKAGDTATMVTGRRLGHPVRSIRNAFAREYAKIEYTDISDEELDAFAAGRLRQAVVDGNEKDGCFLAGQIAGMVNQEQTCEEILKDLMQDCEKNLRRLAEWVK